MRRHGLEIILIFAALALIAFCAQVFQTSRNAYIQDQKLDEIVVQVVKRHIKGSIRWRIQKCRHWIEYEDGRMRMGHLGDYLDCRERAMHNGAKITEMRRKDI